MTLSVRRGRPEDVEAVRTVAAAAWRDTYAGLLRPETIEAFIAGAYSVERMEQRISSTFVVEDGSQVVAFAGAVELPDRVDLVAIYALPERRGQGAGSLLLDAVRAAFRGQTISADVLDGNRKGEAFYEAKGFVPRERLEAQLFGEAVVERRWWLEFGRSGPGAG
jgi:GNAT superfamily N-acetyltransferase